VLVVAGWRLWTWDAVVAVVRQSVEPELGRMGEMVRWSAGRRHHVDEAFCWRSCRLLKRFYADVQVVV